MSDNNYNGTTPIKVRDKVRILDTQPYTDEVAITLASKFITKQGNFYLYKDKGVTWDVHTKKQDT